APAPACHRERMFASARIYSPPNLEAWTAVDSDLVRKCGAGMPEQVVDGGAGALGELGSGERVAGHGGGPRLDDATDDDPTRKNRERARPARPHRHRHDREAEDRG